MNEQSHRRNRRAFTLIEILVDIVIVAVLAGMIGGAGVIWIVGGMAFGLIYLLLRARRGHRGDQARAIVWTVVAALAACGLLARGGLSIPSVTLAAAFTWGLLPAMLSRGDRRRSGLGVFVAFAALMLLLGLSQRGGLADWMTAAFGGDDQILHGLAGFFLTLILAWLMGARRTWMGLLAIIIIILLGGVGEMLQGLLSRRHVELSDWLAHAIGCAVATPLYLLCMGSRWCESPDVRPVENEAKNPYLR